MFEFSLFLTEDLEYAYTKYPSGESHIIHIKIESTNVDNQTQKIDGSVNKRKCDVGLAYKVLQGRLDNLKGDVDT